MPLPGWLGRFNRGVTNRVTGPLAKRLPGFAVVTHEGRRSGWRYHTPVNLFRSGDRYVIALTYGRDRDWVKNVLAAGGCEVETRGTSMRLAQPRIVVDEQGTLVPRPIRPILKAIGVTEFMELRLNPRHGIRARIEADRRRKSFFSSAHPISECTEEENSHK